MKKDVYGKLGIVKAGPDANPAYLTTRHLKAEVVERHMEALAFRRQLVAPQVRQA